MSQWGTTTNTKFDEPSARVEDVVVVCPSASPFLHSSLSSMNEDGLVSVSLCVSLIVGEMGFEPWFWLVGWLEKVAS